VEFQRTARRDDESRDDERAESDAMAETRFVSAPLPSWREGAKQKILGSDYNVYEPSPKLTDEFPSQLEFELSSNQAWMFGPMSRFFVEGVFQSKAPAAATWTPVTAAEYEKVVVIPNFWDALIKGIDVFNGNVKITTSDEAKYVVAHLNAYLYAMMDPLAKKLLCPELCHPGNGVPTKVKGWSAVEADGDEWQKYSKLIFTGGEINFHYIPLHVFPLYQQSNYLVDGNVPTSLPMPNLDKFTIRITFVDKQDGIFKAIGTNDKMYRFKLVKFDLMIEQARLSSAFEKSFFSKNQRIAYSGLTKIMRSETINAASTTYKCHIPSVPLPESIFIFALHKNILSGNYTYKTNTDLNVFVPHNIKSFSFFYDGKTYAIKEPNFGDVNLASMEVKSLIDHMYSPPFGMLQNDKLLTLASVHEGGINTPYPHVYINLTNFGDKTRIVPLLTDGSIVSKFGDIDINLTFASVGGSATNANYIVYLSYTDVNTILDVKTNSFYSPYILKASQ
jgi:hypothetical protein